MRPALALVALLSAAAAQAEAPTLHRLDGSAPLSSAGRPLALIFWRADCPPCLVELKNARAYVEAAGTSGQVMFVGLQQPDVLRRAAARLSLPPEATARADGDAETVLAAYGGSRALPFAVVLAPSGEVCLRHQGLLGTDLLGQAMQTCGGGDARD
jgi:hypothetical protein